MTKDGENGNPYSKITKNCLTSNRLGEVLLDLAICVTFQEERDFKSIKISIIVEYTRVSKVTH